MLTSRVPVTCLLIIVGFGVSCGGANESESDSVIFKAGAFGPGVDGPVTAANVFDIEVTAELDTAVHSDNDTASYRVTVGSSNYGGTPNRGYVKFVFNPIIKLADHRDWWVHFDLRSPVDCDYGYNETDGNTLSEFGFVPSAGAFKSVSIPVSNSYLYSAHPGLSSAQEQTSYAFALGIPMNTTVYVSHVRWSKD